MESQAARTMRRTSPTPDPGQGDRGGISRSPFKCNVCQRTYARIDHLSRHFRLHTSERPYRCEVCSKAFNRPDLLKRHALGHEDNARGQQKNRPHRARRVSQACRACAAAKLKCKEEKPCHRCVNKHITCEYNDIDPSVSEWQAPQLSSARGTTLRSVNNLLSQDPITPYSGDFEVQISEQRALYDTPASDRAYGEAGLNNGSQNSVAPARKSDRDDEIFLLSSEAPMMEDENMFADFLRDIMMPAPLEQFNNQPQQASDADVSSMAFRDLLSFGIDSNIELSDDDCTLINLFPAKDLRETTEASEVTGNAVRQELYTPQPDISSHNNANHLELGIKAFRSSLWCWNPAYADTGSIEQQQLTLQPSETNDHSTSSSQALHINADCLTSAARDKIVAMVLSTTSRSSFAKMMSSFPPVELLDDLMHFFFAFHIKQSDIWIHVPTFKVRSQRAELLGSIISAGAVLSASLPVRRLGFAIHEAVRQALPRVCEENNSATRDLGLLQAMILNLDIGLWSGNKRRIELAESHAGVVTTMCRRASRFLRSSYRAIVPLEDDEDDVLEDKWKLWAYQESLKRLVFVLFTRDAQTSISFVVPTIISYAELSLPLPESQDLFLARTSGEWKSTYLSRAITTCSNERLPSLQQCLYDITPLSNPSINTRIDIPLSLSIIAYGIWRQILEYRQLNSVAKAYPPSHLSHSVLVLEHRHQELLQTLQLFSISFAELEVANKGLPYSYLESKMLVELLLTHLHVSFENIQLFAGREGEEEARRVYPSLQLWATSRESRTALFHAGQVIRYAKLLNSKRCGLHGGVRDFFAVAVYHAALTFWTFGILNLKPGYNGEKQQTTTSDQRDGVRDHNACSREELVWLDIEENAATKLFIALRRGTPCFSTVTSTGVEEIAMKDTAALRDPQRVMRATVQILRGTCGNGIDDMPPPPLVDNLSQLIMELGDAAKSV